MNNNIFYLGDSGEQIKEINSILKHFKYPCSADIEKFNAKTRIGILAFQNDFGMPLTGQVDAKTWEVLSEIAKNKGYIMKYYTPEKKHIPAPVPIPAPENPKIVHIPPPETESAPIPEPVDMNTEPISEYTSPMIRIEEPEVTEPLTEPLNLPPMQPLNSSPMQPLNPSPTQPLNPSPMQPLNPSPVQPLKMAEPIITESQVQPVTERPVLRIGDRGTSVAELQLALRTLGYYTDTPDGIFGVNTQNAVRNFQISNNLTGDGIVGPITWAMIDRAIEEHEIVTPTGSRPILREGDTGVRVKELQLMLALLGFYTGEPDGIFGPKTTEAVRDFQLSRRLTPDGIVGPITWEAIDNAFSASPNLPPPDMRPVIREGDKGDYVVILQTRLRDLGVYSGNVDGIFGSVTTAAVKKFQEMFNLTADGVVGPKTWAALDNAMEYSSLRPTLKEGDSGNYVTILQVKLYHLGYLVASVTGSFGPETTTAVKEFQKANNLTADGIVGPRTWEVLYSMTAVPAPPPTTTPPSGTPKPTLRYGDTGEYVVYLQKELTALMFYFGPISGDFDWQTAVAVKSFQDVNRLTPDGVVGRFTWFALDSLFPVPVIC